MARETSQPFRRAIPQRETLEKDNIAHWRNSREREKAIRGPGAVQDAEIVVFDGVTGSFGKSANLTIQQLKDEVIVESWVFT